MEYITTVTVATPSSLKFHKMNSFSIPFWTESCTFLMQINNAEFVRVTLCVVGKIKCLDTVKNLLYVLLYSVQVSKILICIN